MTSAFTKQNKQNTYIHQTDRKLAPPPGSDFAWVLVWGREGEVNRTGKAGALFDFFN